MSEENQNKQQFLLGLFGGIAVVAVIGLIIMAVVLIGDKKDDGDNQANANQVPQGNEQPGDQAGPTATPSGVDGAPTFFKQDGAEVCKEDGKPVVYLFSTTWCPHCEWIIDAFDSTMKKHIDAGEIVAYHWEVDINDDTLTDGMDGKMPNAHSAIYRQFNPRGSIPTFVFGCKYWRIGNGHEQENDLDAEIAEFEALIADLIK